VSRSAFCCASATAASVQPCRHRPPFWALLTKARDSTLSSTTGSAELRAAAPPPPAANRDLDLCANDDEEAFLLEGGSRSMVQMRPMSQAAPAQDGSFSWEGTSMAPLPAHSPAISCVASAVTGSQKLKVCGRSWPGCWLLVVGCCWVFGQRRRCQKDRRETAPSLPPPTHRHHILPPPTMDCGPQLTSATAWRPSGVVMSSPIDLWPSTTTALHASLPPTEAMASESPTRSWYLFTCTHARS